jgi:hypothetical protein
MDNSPLLSVRVLENMTERLSEVDVMLHNVWYLARLCADMTGDKPIGTLQVNAEAIGMAMNYFAGELAAARASVESLHHLVSQLCKRT